MTDKYRPELALFNSIIKNDTTPNIVLSEISSGDSGTITLEQPVELSIEKPIKMIIPIPISETIDSKPLDVAASGTITKEQSKEVNQEEAEVIIKDIPIIDYPIIDEDVYPLPTHDTFPELAKVLNNIMDRLEILENKKSFIKRMIEWVKNGH